jgi:hypothetical protein
VKSLVKRPFSASFPVYNAAIFGFGPHLAGAVPRNKTVG